MYKSIGRKDRPWFCSKCLCKSLESVKQTKSIEDRCSDFLCKFQEKIESRFENLEGEVKEVKQSLVDMKAEIVNEVRNATGSSENVVDIKSIQGNQPTPLVQDTVVKQAAHELQSRLDRRNNVAFYNVKENISNLKEECMNLDKNLIYELCSDIGLEVGADDVKHVKRVGKKGQTITIESEEVVVPRILIATLTEDAKAKIMRNAYKLASCTSEYYRKIGVKHDKTREERQREGELKKEAKDKNENESGNFIYLVRGMPWDRKLVRVRKGGGHLVAKGPNEDQMN